MRILFMGTPEFAVASLDRLHSDGQQIIAVVTSPDKPSGRGQKLKSSPVKAYAMKQRIPVLQPEKLKSPAFLDQLHSLSPDLIVVVAFRMLPEEVWALPPRGTINLHASLLPQYRGAAPINWVLINGERETGVTTFFIEKEIDTGKIIDQTPVSIDPGDNAGSLHDKLMLSGAELVSATVDKIASGKVKQIDQQQLIKPGTPLKPAPKIHKSDCRIDWGKPLEEVFNLIRGLSPVPAAWTRLETGPGEVKNLKIFEAGKETIPVNHSPGTLLIEDSERMEVSCMDGILHLRELQLEGKKRMKTVEFLRGIRNPEMLRLV